MLWFTLLLFVVFMIGCLLVLYSVLLSGFVFGVLLVCGTFRLSCLTCCFLLGFYLLCCEVSLVCFGVCSSGVGLIWLDLGV